MIPATDESNHPPAEILLHRGTSLAQPDVFLAERDGRRYVVKDFSARPLWLRHCFGRAILRRECRALQALQGLQGIPGVRGFEGPDRLLIEYIEGPGALGDPHCLKPEESPPVEFFHRLRAMLAGVHERGLTHGDLRRRNVLLGMDGAPYLIDFATAISREGRWGPIRRVCFALSRATDINGALNLQRSFYPDSLTPDERAALASRPWPLRLGRYVRHDIYRRLIKPRTWRRRIRRWREAASRRDRRPTGLGVDRPPGNMHVAPSRGERDE